MDIYLLPTRSGGYSLYGGEIDAPTDSPVSGSDPNAPTDSRARKIWAFTKKSYDRLTYRRQQKEFLLKTLGALERVRILYPSSISPNEARQAYGALLQEAAAKHKKWMLVNSAAVPASIPLTLIPGPNVLLAYLAWRSVSHYKTKKASERAAELEIAFVSEPILSRLADLVQQWPFRARRRIRALGDELGLTRLDQAY